jgi:AcrR family transcriptional regulator
VPKISPAKKDARREQILSAAMRLFARQGFRATTVPEICAEAGLSVGALYSYYDSKDAIIAALMEGGQRGTEALAADPARSGPAGASLEALLRELERPGREVINQVDVRFLAEAIGDPRLRDGYLKSYDGMVAILAERLGPRPDGGPTRAALAELAAAVLVGLQVRKAVAPDADISPALEALLALLAT